MRRAAVLAVALAGLPLLSARAQEPWRDLQAIVNESTPGAVVVLEPGRYRGGVQITRPITLVGGPGVIIDAAGVGSGITVSSPDVTLRALTIVATGISPNQEDAAVSANVAPRLTVEGCVFRDVLFGVFLRQSPDSVIRDNEIGAKDLDPARRGDGIRLWESDGTVVSANVVEGGRDSVAYYSDRLTVTGNRFSGGRYGFHVMTSDGVTIANNLITENSVGVYLMYSRDVVIRDNVVAGNSGPSGFGLGLKDVDGLTVAGNHIVGNRVGIYFDNAPVSPAVTHRLEGNRVAANEVGLLFNPSVHGNLFVGNSFSGNGRHVALTGSGRLGINEWSEAGAGNHWDDYRGYDADGDGIGDLAYRPNALFSSLTDRHPELGLYSGTPASRALDLAARLLPAIEPAPAVVDEAPLVGSPSVPYPIPGAAPDDRGPLFAISTLMLGAAAMLLTATAGARSR